MNRKELVENILELTNLCGVSSKEERVSGLIKEKLSGLNYQVTIDRIGNLLFEHKNNSKAKKTLLIFAHIDEIGIIVRDITDDGFILYDRVGGVNTQILPGTRFVFDGSQGLVEGVVGVKAHHFMPANEKFTVPQIVEQYIDICASSKDEVLAKGIDIGTLGGFAMTTKVVDDRYIRGKTIDNRVSVAVLMEIIKTFNDINLDYNLCVCFPVQEEFNIRGLIPVIRKLNPDLSIGIDITPCCDTPHMSYNSTSLENGPSLCVFNFHGGGTLAGVLPYRKFNDYIIKTAKEANINLQKDVAPGVITENAFAIFENEEGIRVGNLSIPCRYTHTPFETVAIEDVVKLFELLEKALSSNIYSIM